MNKISKIALSVLAPFFSMTAFADSYSYRCDAEIALGQNSAMLYTVEADVSFDSEMQKITELGDAMITVAKATSTYSPEIFVVEQPLEQVAGGDRYLVLDFAKATNSLTARLSLAGGAEKANCNCLSQVRRRLVCKGFRANRV